MTDLSTVPSIADLQSLNDSGWTSRSVKRELHDNLLRMLAANEPLFPGMVGYDQTVIPEVVLAVLAQHDMLFLGEKGQGKSRLMRQVVRLLDPWLPYLAFDGMQLHEDPHRPITAAGREYLASRPAAEVRIGWWPREQRYVERLSPGTKFADIIGEIDPGKLTSGVSLGSEEAISLGLIPRMHRGIFAMNELPELDDLVQVGLFNILEERDVQIRGYPVRFDLDLAILFSANPSTYNRSGKVILQLKDRIGSLIQTHYPRERDQGIEILRQEVGDELGGEFPVVVPYFMYQVIEEITVQARQSPFVDHASGVSARFSLANFRTMVAAARRRGVLHREQPAVPRISDLGHLFASSLGKLELDLMGSHQMTEKQVLEDVISRAIEVVFDEYVEAHGLAEIGEVFRSGVRVEVGDLLPSSQYAERLERVPAAWEKAFEVNASEDLAMRASCVEFVLAGLHSKDLISRASRHGQIEYDT